MRADCAGGGHFASFGLAHLAVPCSVSLSSLSVWFRMFSYLKTYAYVYLRGRRRAGRQRRSLAGGLVPRRRSRPASADDAGSPLCMGHAYIGAAEGAHWSTASRTLEMSPSLFSLVFFLVFVRATTAGDRIETPQSASAERPAARQPSQGRQHT